MESTFQAPYAFFDYLFTISIYDTYKTLEEEEKIQKFKYKDFQTTFLEYLGVPHTDELLKSKKLVEQNIAVKMANKKELEMFLDFSKTKLAAFSDTQAYKDFEFVRTYVKELQNQLEVFATKLLRRELDIRLSNNSSPFRVKNGIKISCFKELYDLAVDYKLITADYSQEDFIEVFTADSTSKIIKFSCDNAMMGTFLKNINALFENFTLAAIERSKRFKTKQGNLITATTMSNSLRGKKSEARMEDLEEDIFTLLDVR